MSSKLAQSLNWSKITYTGKNGESCSEYIHKNEVLLSKSFLNSLQEVGNLRPTIQPETILSISPIQICDPQIIYNNALELNTIIQLIADKTESRDYLDKDENVFPLIHLTDLSMRLLNEIKTELNKHLDYSSISSWEEIPKK